MANRLRDNLPEHRYELLVGTEVVGFADYVLHGSTIVLPHTVVNPAHRNQGHAATLVRLALDDIRAKGLRVDPQCWYVAQFIDDHDEYRDLLVG